MIPAWVDRPAGWKPCWLISTAPHGGTGDQVMIAFDDDPGRGDPAGSLRLECVNRMRVRIRRNVIPLMEKPDGD